MANGHGGRRPGAGRKPGTRNKSTETIGGVPIFELASAHSRQAVETLAEIMKDQAAPAAARVSAANSILDRAHGKPVQATVEVQAESIPAPFTGWAIERVQPDQG